MSDGTRGTGPWLGRVRFAPGGGFAYRPSEVVVREGVTEIAVEQLRRTMGLSADELRRDEPSGGAFVRLSGTFDTLDALGALEEAGVPAQPNHVLFATGCCPPHPASPEAEAFYANPFYAKALAANPFYAKPFYAKPFYAKSGSGCCCCGGGTSANPFYAKALAAYPFYAKADPSPFLDPSHQATGRRRSSARPAAPPNLTGAKGGDVQVRIAILDTGWAETHAPTGLPGMNLIEQGGDRPDVDGDQFLDPAAGHGTFIAGIIEQEAPGCTLEVISVLSSYGDGDEVDVGEALLELAARPDGERPHLVNLSFGGYTPIGMAVLANAIAQLRQQGTVVVASAGNDATCAPLFPAALPGVVGVGALDSEGNAAPFTNYGPWVDASTNGVDLVSIFFEGFDGAEPPTPNGDDEDDFRGWAVWSGTSFSAPRLVAALARLVQTGETPEDAVERLVTDPKLPRKPMLGTVG